MDDLTWLMSWYRSHCDGDWEHTYGVKITTLDNPGWWLSVALEGTSLEGRSLPPTSHNLTADDDWWDVSTRDDEFIGACSPLHLTTLLRLFRAFAEGREVR